jgi:DNA-binding transcriptional LysR family regulator
MNLKHIEAFRAVMLAGSMTAAAKELFTSQPNISRLITQLERETGLLLFQRSGVRLIPTSEGNAFFREVERLCRPPGADQRCRPDQESG